jgi:hypothetical protein
MRRIDHRANRFKKLGLLAMFAALVLCGAGTYVAVRAVLPHDPIGDYQAAQVVEEAPAFDVSRMPACPHESGPPASDPRPCVWDAATMGSDPGGYVGPRWLVYLPMCPLYGPLVQNRAEVECRTIGAD